MTDGFTTAQFDAVRAAFARNLSEGPEHGGAVAVWVDGQPVVDLWGGTRDLARSLPWQRDTLVNVWSVGKGVVALAVAMLVERGQLDYQAPVARYWPEFAANGKQHITVDQVMSHQAGLDGLAVALPDVDRYDWDAHVAALAAMAPNWPPGSVCVYHPMTYGFLAGELVRRVDGRSVGRFVAEEIAEPLDMAFWFGLPEAQDHRVAELSADDKLTVSRARKLQKFLSQPFTVAEVFTGTPGKYVKVEDTVKGFKKIVDGECDEVPEQAFYMVGGIDDVYAKAKTLA